MGEGTTQSPVPLDKCSNCSEQDIIDIAGKKFCANCGTPQPTPAPTAATTSSTAPTVADSTSAVAAATPPATPAPSLSHGPIVSDIDTSQVSAMPSTDSAVVAAPTVPPQLPSQDPTTIPAEPDPTSGAVAPSEPATLLPTNPVGPEQIGQASDDSVPTIKLKPKADELHAALQATPSAGIQKYGAAATTSQAVDVLDPVAERAGSEIKSLTDKNDETVMSDDALAELAKAPNEPLIPQQADQSGEDGATVDTSEPKADTVESPASTPESSYKLDLTKPQSNNNSLPKAVSDVRLAPVAALTKPFTATSSSSAAPESTIMPLQALPTDATLASPGSSGASTAAPSPLAIPAADPAVAGLETFSALGSAPVPPAPVGRTTPVTGSMPPTQSVQPVQPAQSVPPVLPTANPTQSVAGTTGAVNPVNAPGVTIDPAMSGGVSMSNVMDANAAADKDTKPASGGVKLGSVALSLVGLFLVGAYVWQVNYPNLALKVAASKAGISANFPGYVPSGWRMSGNIISTPGNISYNLSDGKGSKSLAVKESKTDWDSQALAENYVAPKASNYLALQSQGLTIYIYDGNQASWVNNGTWYRIEGKDHGLSQDQIIKLATSL